MQNPDIKNLKSSWTKFDSVKVIQVTVTGKLIEFYEEHGSGIDEPVFKNYIGVNTFEDELPKFWEGISKYPEQIGLFALIAALTTHYENIDWFANEYSSGNMQGVMIVEEGKHFTNLRSALVESGASEKIFRRKKEVPYDLSKLFEIGRVGELTRLLLINRLTKCGFSQKNAENNFIELSTQYDFHKLLSLTEEQYIAWTSGEGISNSLYELNSNSITYEKYHVIKALKVKQWLAEWNNVPSYNTKNRNQPQPYFYQFNIPALLLKRLYNIHSRQATTDRVNETASQRRHSLVRSSEIKEFIKGGFPWSTISDAQRESQSYKNLQMPGWLPTSIIANILGEGSERKQTIIDKESLIKVNEVDENFVDIILPEAIWSEHWTPIIAPIEIIDGQHRIKAFDSIRHLNGNYELPVIAFFNLDFTWQAYLFYTINIKPKRINTSLAYDLMPLLRIQEWLEHDLNGPDIYKKVRAQELTEILWNNNASPWFGRINMLGDSGQNKGGPVSQNAFINSLAVSFVKKWDGNIGGLFGGEMHKGEQDVIQWDKETQAAFLILIWQTINNAIFLSKAEWNVELNKSAKIEDNQASEIRLALGFTSDWSFFTTDQGIRPVLQIFNDMCFVAYDQLKLNKFLVDLDYEKFTNEEVIKIIIDRFKSNKTIYEFLQTVSRNIINGFDWRTPSAFNPYIPAEDEKRQHQNQFKGSGGYREMRVQLLKVLSGSSDVIDSEDGKIIISDLAKEIQDKLKY